MIAWSRIFQFCLLSRKDKTVTTVTPVPSRQLQEPHGVSLIRWQTGNSTDHFNTFPVGEQSLPPYPEYLPHSRPVQVFVQHGCGFQCPFLQTAMIFFHALDGSYRLLTSFFLSGGENGQGQVYSLAQPGLVVFNYKKVVTRPAPK